MSGTWHKAVEDYVNMRRSLGFKLHEAMAALLNFASFLEQSGASHLTIALALQWAQQDRQHALSNGPGGSVWYAGLRVIGVRMTRKPKFHHGDCCLTALAGHGRTYIAMMRCKGCSLPRSSCHRLAVCAVQHTTVSLGCCL